MKIRFRSALAVVASTLMIPVVAVAAPVVAVAPAGAQTAFTISGGGFGHGVGMSQYGARGRADAGQSAAQILGAYYQGTQITGTGPNGPRVKIGESAAVEVSVAAGAMTGLPEGGGWAALANPGEHLVLRVNGSGVTAQRTSPTVGAVVPVSNGRFTLGWTQGQPLSASGTGHTYRWGNLTLQPRGGVLQLVIDTLSMDQYLNGLGEVPSSWPTEALRAQAIAGRTYAAYRIAHPQSSDFELYASTLDQAYVGADKELGASGDRWVQAVADTSGQVLSYNGTVIQAFYSSSNGGSSENSEYVWASALPYLRAVADPWDQASGNTRFSWTQTYTDTELQSWLAASGRGNIGPVTSLSIGGNVGASGRIDKASVTLSGNAGAVTMTGNQFRSMVNAYASASRDLPSTKLSVSGAAPLDPTTAPASPQGRADLVAAWGPKAAVVVGWAADANVPSAALAIHVYVDGRFAGATTANVHRKDLESNARFGADHGFVAAVKAPNAVTTVCLYAINAGDASPNTKLGCTTIDRRPKKAVKKVAKKVTKKKVVKKKVVAKRKTVARKR